MADITRTAADVRIVFPDDAKVFDFVAAEDLEAGQPVMGDASAGTVKRADANDAARDELLGIALKSVKAGQPTGVLKRGHVTGFTLSQNYFTPLYVSNTLGELADTVGTANLPVGIILPMPDSTPTKLLYVDVRWSVDLIGAS